MSVRSTWQSLSTSVVIAMLPILLVSVVVENSFECNESVCARVVAKCLLTESCKCDLGGAGGQRNYSCHRECFGCLAELCHDCCSCFGMCPRASPSGPASRLSSVEQLDEALPQLFELHAAGDEHRPPRFAALSLEQRKWLGGRLLRRNCSLLFLAACRSAEQCAAGCRALGASFVRWFHHGCCQCAGQSCLDYGLPEARCARCPPPAQPPLPDDPRDLDYGQDDEEHDADEVAHSNWTPRLTHADEKLEAAWKDPGNRTWDD